MIDYIKLNDDKTGLMIKASIPDNDYTTGVYYTYVKIDNQYSVVDSGPSEKAAEFAASIIAGDDRDPKELDGTLLLNNIDIALEQNGVLVDKKNIYYVYLVNNGEFSPLTPCGQDSEYESRAVWDNDKYLQKGLSFLKTFGDECSAGSVPSKDFINFILQDRAMTLANETGNYALLNSLWNDANIFSASGTVKVSTNKCGCNG